MGDATRIPLVLEKSLVDGRVNFTQKAWKARGTG
jgi:hypothetical protein